MAEVTVEPLVGPYNLGEGPHWDPVSQKLYFVDIFAQKVFTYDPSTKALTSTYVEHGPVGFVLPMDGASDKLVVGCRTEILMLTWNGKKDLAKCESRKLATTGANPKEIRWNDAKADASGRIWGGTMGYETNGTFPHGVGALYCVDNDLSVKTHLPSVSISNGIAWTPNEDTFYYIDSLTYKVEAYDYNPQTATISNRRTVFDLKKTNISGIPDGMTIDTNGNLWVALYGGGGIIQIKPETGELLRFINISNVDNITSVAFGDADLDTLYVTTSTVNLSEEQLKQQPHAGYLFAVKGLGARGFPANSFKLANK